MNLIEKHQDSIKQATDAFYSRDFYVHFPEMPSPKNYGEGAAEKGLKEYNQMVGQIFDTLHQDKDEVLMSDEESCFDSRNIGNFYPIYNNSDDYIKVSQKAFQSWKKTAPQFRAALLMECLEKIKEKVFEIAHASMHTTGKGFMMAFQASGPHAFDRCVEAIVAGLKEQEKYPSSVDWKKPMGKFELNVHRTFKPHPLGVSLAIGCSTFPVWNTLPGVFASLVTGNTSIVKPHPTSIFPLAICISVMQSVFKSNDVDPLIVQLASDTVEKPITKQLAEHKDIKIIDFTGNSEFGNYLQALPHKKVFSEQNGVNSVLIDSCEDFNKVTQNLSFSVCLFSSQMCTAPQNIFMASSGIKNGSEDLSFDEAAKQITAAVDKMATNPKNGAHTLGAIQNQNTLKKIQDFEEQVKQGKFGDAKILKGLEKVTHPEFEASRTYSPLVVQVNADQKDVYSKEFFGPILFIIKTDSKEHSLDMVEEVTQNHGALSFSLYSTNEEFISLVEDKMWDQQVLVTLNFTGFIWPNQSLSFTDFHGTGGNKASNCSLVDSNFVSNRFHFVGTRKVL